MDKNSQNGRGDRVNNPGMSVFNDAIDCGRVSSIFVSNSTGTTFAEVGWYEDPSGGTWDYSCILSSFGPPRELAYAVQAGMLPQCDQDNADISAGVDSFVVKDPNQDGIWTYEHDGVTIWTSQDISPFNSGLLVSNGERAGTGNDDPAKSEFDGLDRLGPSNNWVPWTSPSEYTPYSDDPDYKDCIDSDTHIRVIKSSNQC